MYEQFLSYWFIWIIFIIVYFFMEKSKKRSFLLFWILFMIIGLNNYFVFDTVQISITFLLLLIGAIIFYVYDSFSIFKMIATFTVMIGYVSLLLWKKITPVWFFMPSYLMIPVISAVLIMLIVHSFYGQITVALISITFGQLIYELIIISYRLHDVIGEKPFFIHISITTLFLIFVQFVQTCIAKMTNLLRRNII